MQDFWLWAERLGVIVALVGVPYLVHQHRKNAPHLDFVRSGLARTSFERDGAMVGRAEFRGTLRNGSLEPNTVEVVYLVVWRTQRRYSTRRFGSGSEILGEDGTKIGPPLALGQRESRRVQIVFETPITGSVDEPLWFATKPVGPTSRFELPRYDYELALEDVRGSLFDAEGKLRSRRAIALHWTIDNAWERLKDGHPLPFVRHLMSITWEHTCFMLRRSLRRVGF